MMNSRGSPPQLTLRDATPGDEKILYDWDKKEHVIFCSGDDDDWNWKNELPRNVSWRRQLIAEVDDGKRIGFMQIIDPKEEESHYWGDDCPPNLRAVDIWIGEEDYLAKGYGTEMMKQALNDYCFRNQSVHAVLVDPLASNLRAHRFYQRCGFRPIGIRFFGQDECLVHQIDRTDWEASLAGV